MKRAIRRGWILVLLCLSASSHGLRAAPEDRAGAVAVLDARFGMRTAPIFLLVRPDVQIDLKLDARRAAEARTAIERLIERGLALKDRSGPVVEEERRRIDEEMTEWLAGALSPSQLDRLRQINMQWEAASALTRPHMVEMLRLNEDQRQAIGRTLRRQEAARSVRGRLSTREIAPFLEEARGALTPSQRTLWTRALGPPCRFSIGETSRAAAKPEAARAAGNERGHGPDRSNGPGSGP